MCIRDRHLGVAAVNMEKRADRLEQEGVPSVSYTHLLELITLALMDIAAIQHREIWLNVVFQFREQKLFRRKGKHLLNHQNFF